MKIALLTPYKDYLGGVETVNEILKKVLKKKGYDLTFLTTDNFKHNVLTKILTKIFGLPFITAYRYRKMIKQYDLVIANGEFSWGITHPKLINIFHGCYIGYRDYLKKIWSIKTYIHLSKMAWIQKKAAKNNYVVCVSSFIKEILSNDGVSVHKVIVNCIDTKLFVPITTSDQRKDYLFIGSYNHYAKGFDILEELSNYNINIHCITNKRPSEKLRWIKNTYNSALPNIINKYRILIFPSRFEGLGLVALEAMSCGLPIVMGKVGLGLELEKSIPEFVVNTFEARDYLKNINIIEKNYEKYSEMARQYVLLNHSFEKYENQWLELVNEFLC